MYSDVRLQPDPYPSGNNRDTTNLNSLYSTLQIPGSLVLTVEGPVLERYDCILPLSPNSIEEVATQWGYSAHDFRDLSKVGRLALARSELVLAEYCAMGMLIQANIQTTSALTEPLATVAAAKLLMDIADQYLEIATQDKTGRARKHAARILSTTAALDCPEIHAETDPKYWIPTTALEKLVSAHKEGVNEKSTLDRLIKTAVEHLSIYNRYSQAVVSLDTIKFILNFRSGPDFASENTGAHQRDPACINDIRATQQLIDKIKHGYLNQKQGLRPSSASYLIQLATALSNLGYAQGAGALFEFLSLHQFSENTASNQGINAQARLARAEHELEIDNYKLASDLANNAADVFGKLEINQHERRKACLIAIEASFEGTAKLDATKALDLVKEYLAIGCFRRATVVLNNYLSVLDIDPTKIDQIQIIKLRVLSKALSCFNIANDTNSVAPKTWAELVRAVSYFDPDTGVRIVNGATFNKDIRYLEQPFKFLSELSKAEAQLMLYNYKRARFIIHSLEKKSLDLSSDIDQIYCNSYLEALKLFASGLEGNDINPGGLLEQAHAKFRKINEYDSCYLIVAELFERLSVIGRQHQTLTLLNLTLRLLPRDDQRCSYLLKLINQIKMDGAHR